MRRLGHILARALLVAVLVPPVLLLAYRWLPPPITPLMLIRLVQGYGLERDWQPSSAVASELRQAVIAAEDNLFCEHWGFDLAALRAELARAFDGERPRGASTISQQTVKNLFLWPGRDLPRKLAEIWLTPQLELILSKERILELYLNVVEFGPGVYGAEAAARHYFDKSAASLELAEAARLAAVLPSPLTWSASRPGPYVRRRTATIQQRMGQLGPLLSCAA